MNDNFIIPSSIIINLSELYIDYKNRNNNLLFLNDINKAEIDLNNLELLKIWTYGKYHITNQINEEISNKYNNKSDIIFHIKKIKYLILSISSNCDYTFIEKYFDLNLLDLLETKPLNKKRTTFIDLINKKEEYFKIMSMKDLQYVNITYTSQYNIIESYSRTFTMKTTRKGLRKYCYSESHFNEDAKISNIICLKEKYEEKENGNKVLKYYENCRDYNNISLNLANNDNINVIKINGKSRKINANKVNDIFEIKKRNYSLEEISLLFEGKEFTGEKYYKSLMKNISKFKVLKKLYLYDPISYEKFNLFLDKISKLKFLEEISIKVDAKLCNNIKGLKDSIKKKFPLCVVEVFDSCFLKDEQKMSKVPNK